MKVWGGLLVLLVIVTGFLFSCEATPEELSSLMSSVLQTVQRQVEESATLEQVLTDEDVRALVEQAIAAATKGSPWENAGLGAIGTALMGFVLSYLSKTRKDKRKLSEVWSELKKAGK